MAKSTVAADPITVDALIVGGGLVGLTLGCALAGAGLPVAVVDRADPAAVVAAEFDGRATAIAHGSAQVLRGIGLWAGMAPHACPIDDIRVADGDSLLFLHYDHRELTGEPFGFMVENRDIRAAIAARLPALGRVRYLAPAAPAAIERTPTGVEVRLDDGRRLVARLAIGADGRGSWLRRQAGIAVTRWSYGQSGIVCAVDHERPHDNIAHEHFLPAGPFAILPLRGNRSSIVWTERDDMAPAMM
ncbi:MAG TPA: FAD-dependent monooxygenase, partial [Afifellaceae bacterium]|nr:FAD-dependent monooxygenase [Afifellaceae bacterium]